MSNNLNIINSNLNNDEKNYAKITIIKPDTNKNEVQQQIINHNYNC